MKIALVLFLLICVSCQPKNRVHEANGENISISNNHSTDKKIEKIISPYRTDMAAQMNIVIGNSTKTFEKKRTATESNLGNWVADIVFSAGLQAISKHKKIDSNYCFTLINKGGLRASLDSGQITRGDIFEIMPFNNEIVVLKIKPAMVNRITSYLFLQNGQPVSNATFKLSSDTSEIKIGDTVYNYDKPVYIITSDYLAKGGDNMKFLLNPIETFQTGILIRDAIIYAIETKQNIEVPADFGRIQLIK